jgi:hypothetical protein
VPRLIQHLCELRHVWLVLLSPQHQRAEVQLNATVHQLELRAHHCTRCRRWRRWRLNHRHRSLRPSVLFITIGTVIATRDATLTIRTGIAAVRLLTTILLGTRLLRASLALGPDSRRASLRLAVPQEVAQALLRGRLLLRLPLPVPVPLPLVVLAAATITNIVLCVVAGVVVR